MAYGNKTPHTDHYDVTIGFTFTERNSYDDALNGGSLEYTRKVKVKSLAELGNLLSKLDGIFGDEI